MTAKKGKTKREEKPDESEDITSVEKDTTSPEPRKTAKDEESPCKSKFQIYRDAVVPFPKLSQSDNEEESRNALVVSEVEKSDRLLANSSEEPRQCPIAQISKRNTTQSRLDKRSKKQSRITQNVATDVSSNIKTCHGPLKSPQTSPTDSNPAGPLPSTSGPSKSLLGSPPEALRSEPANSLLGSPTGARQSELASAAPPRRVAAPPSTRCRRAAATSKNSAPRRSGISGDICAAASPPKSGWAPPPIDEHRRAQLFTVLRNASRGPGDQACDQAVEEAVRAVLYRRHPSLVVQRYCKPPGSLYGRISAETFIMDGTRPVHVHDDLFLAPDSLSREEILTLIRNGQYYRGHTVACFYAYIYAYEFVFFCEYLRQVNCHTEEVRVVLKGVIDRAQSMHLIVNSATIFSLAPEVMFPQRSPLLYLARLFPMEKPWEADLLCDMANCRDFVCDAAKGWIGREHILFTVHRNMCREARHERRPLPAFHPAVTRPPSSKHAHTLFEADDVQKSNSHGIVLFKELGATYTDLDASCRYQPLGELSTEDVLRRSVGRHVLIRLFDDVFFLGAPPADTREKQFRYLRPAEARAHFQVGFYFESPSFTNFLWDTQWNVQKSLREAYRIHAPQLSRDETELVRWLLNGFVANSRESLWDSARELAKSGPFLLTEYNRHLWMAIQEKDLHLRANKLCSDFSEFSRSSLEAALAEHNCILEN